MAIDMSQYRRRRGSSASQSGASSDRTISTDNVMSGLRDSANKSSGGGGETNYATAMAGAGLVAGAIGMGIISQSIGGRKLCAPTVTDFVHNVRANCVRPKGTLSKRKSLT